MPAFNTLINIVLEVLAAVIRQEKEIKVIQLGKEEVKLSLFADNKIVYIENPIVFKKKTTQTNKWIQLSSRIQSQCSEIDDFLVQQWVSERETKKKIQFTIATRKIKQLGINLTKDVNDMYSENYRTL